MSDFDNSNNTVNDKVAYSIIGLVSTIVLAFLFWLIYFKQAAESAHVFTSYLPALNALLNSITTVLLILGYAFIKRGLRERHIITMLMATGTSGLFLISYIIYHHFHGDTQFLTQGWIRPVYFFILISHIILSMVMVPMVFATLYHAFRKNFSKHLKIARITFPIWIYVSITGVMIFFFLQFLNTSA